MKKEVKVLIGVVDRNDSLMVVQEHLCYAVQGQSRCKRQKVSNIIDIGTMGASGACVPLPPPSPQ